MHDIDLLFTDWLHVMTPDGKLTAFTLDNHPFAVVDGNGVHNIDPQGKVMRTITDAHEDTEVFPLVNNFNQLTGISTPHVVEKFLMSRTAQATFEKQMMALLTANPVITASALDFEAIPADAQPAYRQMVSDALREDASTASAALR